MIKRQFTLFRGEHVVSSRFQEIHRVSLLIPHSLLDPQCLSGVFQLGGQHLPNEEERWGLAAAGPLPNPTIFSLCDVDELIAYFREIHPYLSHEIN